MPINDSAAVKPPPRKTGTRSTPVRSTPAPTADTRSLNERRRDGLIGLGQLGQALCMMGGLWADAATIGQHFPPVAVELANIADGSDFIAKPIDFLIEVGPYGALVTAVMPFALQLAANHRLVDASRLANQGVVPPEVLEVQMKAQVARMQTDAMRAYNEALADAQAAQKEYDAAMEERSNGKVTA